MMQVQRLTGELQESSQRETTLAERLNQVAQQQAQMRSESNLGPLVDAITESEKQVVAALQKDKKLTLIENRGVAKPERFGSKDEGFLRCKLGTALQEDQIRLYIFDFFGYSSKKVFF